MSNEDSATTPNEETKAAEEAEAAAAHRADRAPTAEEEAAAPGKESLNPETAGDYEEMAKLGAEVKGEGELP
jgi:hypothetical protein